MKEQKLKEIFFKKITELMNNFTIETHELFEKEILKEAQKLGFDMDKFDMNGEFIDIADGKFEICDSKVLKNIYICYNSDEPFIYYEWY
jgi:hypothetical protein